MFDEMKLSKEDELLIQDLRRIYARFIESDETELRLEPMNSYRRRLAHKLGAEFLLESTSLGEDKERLVCLNKTSKTRIPNRMKIKSPRIDMGNEIFYAKPGVQIVLRSDGSFGVLRGEKREQYLDKRVIQDGMFRIRSNQIVCREDRNW